MSGGGYGSDDLAEATGERLDERALEVGISRLSSEERIQRTLANIHAVAKHLLVVNEIDAMRLFVGVQPFGRGWRVHVSYADFQMEVKEDKLDDALNGTLQKLMSHVSRRLEESTRIISALGGDGGARITKEAIEDAVRAVALVQSVSVSDSEYNLGIVEVHVTPERITTVEERDEMCVRIGAALERVRAIMIRFDVTICGFIYDASGKTRPMEET